MGSLPDLLKQKVGPLVQEEGLEVVELQFSQAGPASVVRVFVDKVGGVTLDQCAFISRKLGDFLDTEDLIPGRYTLEVSSPGLDRPLTKGADFRRKIGERVRIFLKATEDGKMELVGEIKGVQSFKTAWLMQYGAIVLEAITFLIGIAWATDYMGPEFIKSLGYLATFQAGAVPGFEFRGSYALFTVISLNVPLGIIIGLAFAGAMGNSLFNGFLGASRLVLAQSFDRIYPGWFGHVNKRGAPDNILILLTVLSSIAAVILTNYPNLAGVLQLALMAQLIGFAGSILGGVVFPWKAKSLYESSPISKYKVAGIPAITLCGLAGLGMDLWAVAFYFTNPSYGIYPGTTLALTFASLLYIIPFVYYIAIKYYRKSQGINIELAFKEVPPA